MVGAILTVIALSKIYSAIYYMPKQMMKECLCDNLNQWNNSLVATETQSTVHDKEKRNMCPSQPPRVLQISDLMHSETGIICVILTGGLGNNIFQFASTFGIAMSKNMTIIVNKNSYLNYAFKLGNSFKDLFSQFVSSKIFFAI